MGLVGAQETLVRDEHVAHMCCSNGFLSDTEHIWSPLRLLLSMMNFLVCSVRRDSTHLAWDHQYRSPVLASAINESQTPRSHCQPHHRQWET